MFDILIIGGGPAGMSAGIYGARAGKSVAIIEKLVPGGQVALIGQVENYPGAGKIGGADLSMNFFKHAESLGVQFIYDEAIEVSLKGKKKKVVCREKTYEAKTVILALGCASKEFNVPGEKEFFNKGISYCATCDGNFYKNKNVAVVGSGDSSISNALYLSGICKNVYIIVKKDFKINAYKEEVLKPKKNIKVYKNAVVTRIFGDKKLEGIEFTHNDGTMNCDIDGVFVSIGRRPDTKILEGQIKLDEKGYIIPKKEIKTNISGVYACGDIVTPGFKQIVTAASLGAKAATEAIKYINKKS